MRSCARTALGSLLLLSVLPTYTKHILVASFSPLFPTGNKNGPPLRLPTPLREQSSSSEHHEEPSANIRFLGKGTNAIVRPGVVLLAPSNEFHHYYRQAAIFVYAMGEDEDAGNLYVIRGVILDHPTPFTMAEMTEHIQDNPLADNLLYRGGDKGGDVAMMLHNHQDIGTSEMIGTSEIFEGGLNDAIKACQEGRAKPEDFKFYFNFCQFSEDELEQMLENDPWISVEVPPEFVLNAEWDRGDCWKRCRNAILSERELEA